MVKKIWEGVSVFLFMLFSSCSLEGSILEKFFFRENKSGSYSLTVDFKKYASIIHIVEKIEGVENGFSGSIYGIFVNSAENIRKVNGIKNTVLVYNEKLSHFTLSFDFQNLEALNSAMAFIGVYISPGDVVLFKGNNQLIRRLPNFANLFSRLTKETKSTEESFGIKYFLKNLKLTVVYEFENMKIRNPTSGFSKISKNYQIIVYEDFMIDMTEEGTMHNVFLKKVNKL